jgi:hypothetical protein
VPYQNAEATVFLSHLETHGFQSVKAQDIPKKHVLANHKASHQLHQHQGVLKSIMRELLTALRKRQKQFGSLGPPFFLHPKSDVLHHQP